MAIGSNDGQIDFVIELVQRVLCGLCHKYFEKSQIGDAWLHFDFDADDAIFLVSQYFADELAP